MPNFTWLDSTAKVPALGTVLAAAAALKTPQIVQIVVYDLPDRDCAAKASNGEFSVDNGGQALYFKYIDSIVALIKRQSRIPSAVLTSFSPSQRFPQNTPLCALWPLSSQIRLPIWLPT